MSSGNVRYVLEPEDEYTHTPDEASNYNESMYLNAFDVRGGAGSELGAGSGSATASTRATPR